MTLPDVPQQVLENIIQVLAGIRLEEQAPGAGERCPRWRSVPCNGVTLMNPRTGGVFAPFGAHLL